MMKFLALDTACRFRQSLYLRGKVGADHAESESAREDVILHGTAHRLICPVLAVLSQHSGLDNVRAYSLIEPCPRPNCLMIGQMVQR